MKTTTKGMKNAVKAAGYLMQRIDYLAGHNGNGYGGLRIAVGHRWEIHHRANGKFTCRGVNPAQAGSKILSKEPYSEG